MTAHRVGPHVQTGYIAGTSIAANTYKDYSLTYPVPFDSTPMTVVSFSTGSTAGGMGRLGVGTVGESETGCTIRVWNGDTAARSPSLKWVAIV